MLSSPHRPPTVPLGPRVLPQPGRGPTPLGNRPPGQLSLFSQAHRGRRKPSTGGENPAGPVKTAAAGLVESPCGRVGRHPRSGRMPPTGPGESFGKGPRGRGTLTAGLARPPAGGAAGFPRMGESPRGAGDDASRGRCGNPPAGGSPRGRGGKQPRILGERLPRGLGERPSGA